MLGVYPPAADDPAPDSPAASGDTTGPSIAECARDDRRWFDAEKGGA
ncbi:hypothetical protein [Streptomyces sp. NBC_01261]|nr:hypothetical protein [Streptomyces sp. NBC_01261]